MKWNQLFLGLMLCALVGVACNPFASPTPTPMLMFPTPLPMASATPILPTATPPPSISTPPPLPPELPTATKPATILSSTPQPTVNRIRFPQGGIAAIQNGTVAANGIDRYAVRALAGQTMSVSFTSAAENLTIQVSGADGSVLASGSAKFSTAVFDLTLTQDYFITVMSARNTPTNYIFEVTVYPLRTSTPAAPTPTSMPRRLTFTSGRTSATATGSTFTTGQDRFVIRALEGQMMTVDVLSAQASVIVIIYGADGNVLISDHAGVSSWRGVLPKTQDYFIDTRSVGAKIVPFTLNLTIPPK